MKPHKWAKEIKAWADGAEIERKYQDRAWVSVSEPTWDFGGDFEYRIKPQPSAKCIVKDCINHTNEGKFVGELCAPCWDYITNGKGVHSQAYRNAQPKEPQYLYVLLCHSDGQFKLSQVPIECHPPKAFTYIGKIKLETDNEE